ncbi:MAG: GLUG motif-containing protein [Candidatus Woesearchaeota archaeon]
MISKNNLVLISFVAIITISGFFYISNPTQNNITGMITGSGTSIDPYVIVNCSDLNETRNDLSGYYILGNDIDCSDTINWNGGAGFEPIGDWSTEFSGHFEGNYFNIYNLFINRSTETEIGLFGLSSGNITNLGLININITGDDYVGGLVAYMLDGEINNCYTTGNISTNWGDIGGLVGDLDTGVINNSYSTANIVGDYTMGGLVGASYYSTTIIENSYASGTLTGSGDSIGGLVGDFVGTIRNCSSNITVQGTNYIGGLVGALDGTIIDSYASGTVTATGYSIGGLLAHTYGGSIIQSCYATGNVSATGIYVGGLIGDNYGFVNNSYALGTVTSSDRYVGGLIGDDGGETANSYATGDVTGKWIVGGLVGNSGKISNSYATGDVTGESDSVSNISFLGGLVGQTGDDIINCYATGDVTGTGTQIGAFVGKGSGGVISNSFSTGSVSVVGTDIGAFMGGKTSTLLNNVFWYNASSTLDCYYGGNENCTAISDVTYFHDYDNAPTDVWDFTNIWDDVYEFSSYPIFQSLSLVSDTTDPIITLVSPSDGTSSTINVYDFKFNVIETNPTITCDLIIDGVVVASSSSISNISLNSINHGSLSVATHTWSINCTDGATNIGSSSERSFTVISSYTSPTSSSSDDDMVVFIENISLKKLTSVYVKDEDSLEPLEGVSVRIIQDSTHDLLQPVADTDDAGFIDVHFGKSDTYYLYFDKTGYKYKKVKLFIDKVQFCIDNICENNTIDINETDINETDILDEDDENEDLFENKTNFNNSINSLNNNEDIVTNKTSEIDYNDVLIEEEDVPKYTLEILNRNIIILPFLILSLLLILLFLFKRKKNKKKEDELYEELKAKDK